MYNLFLYFKWIKYSKLKLPLKVRSYSQYSSNKLESIAGFPDMLYILRTKSNKKAVATFRGYKYFSSKKKINNNYAGYIYKWNFLGYEKDTPMKDCSFKEFKNIYSTFFYPHLVSEETITSCLVVNALAPDEERESIPEIFLIR